MDVKHYMVLYMNEHLHLFKDYLLFLAGEWITHGHIPGELIQPMDFLKKCEKAPRPRPPLQNKCLHVYITSKHIKAVEDLLLSSWQEINQKKRKTQIRWYLLALSICLKIILPRRWGFQRLFMSQHKSLKKYEEMGSFFSPKNANSRQNRGDSGSRIPLGYFWSTFV